MALKIRFSTGFGLVESKVTSKTETSSLSGILFVPRTKITLMPFSSTRVRQVLDGVNSEIENEKPVKGEISIDCETG